MWSSVISNIACCCNHLSYYVIQDEPMWSSVRSSIACCCCHVESLRWTISHVVVPAESVGQKIAHGTEGCSTKRIIHKNREATGAENPSTNEELLTTN